MDLSNHQHFLTVRDHSVSTEEFELYKNEALDMLITTPQPKGDDLAKYYESDDYISHTDAKRSLFEKAYQLVKNIALKNKLQVIDSFHPDKGDLLDIGAGTGDFLTVAKNNGWMTTGIEPSQKAKSIAIKKNVSFVNDVSDLENNSFDVITMWHVLEHVPDLETQIRELKRLLKPNGTILIAVPNYNSYDAKYYKEFWAAYDVPRHLWHFSKTAIKLIFEKENIELIRIVPMKFDSYYVCLLSEKYKNGKMNFFKALWVGLRSNRKAASTFEYSSHIYILKNAKKIE
jgi:2-polyprenyl-3-methyl-5-hydroxy-6-metoxy-1,4-benzoquinol methylase